MHQFIKIQCYGSRQDYDDLFVYEHSGRFSYSSIKMAMMAKLCIVNESIKLLTPCPISSCHESFLPYFYSNGHCKSLASHLKDSRLTDLLKNKAIFHNTEPAGNYSEDDWTERLHNCLIFNNFQSEFVAHYRNDETKKSWTPRLPAGAGVNDNCVLFQGSPDLIISKEHTDEGIISMNSQDEVVQQQDEEEDEESGSQGSDCSDSGSLQMGHQMSCTSYKQNSFLAEKVGGLIAALHTVVTCRALRNYVSKRNCKSVKAHGLHIRRAVGIIHVQLTLSENTLQFNAQHLIDGVISPALLCGTLTYFMEELNKHT